MCINVIRNLINSCEADFDVFQMRCSGHILVYEGLSSSFKLQDSSGGFDPKGQFPVNLNVLPEVNLLNTTACQQIALIGI